MATVQLVRVKSTISSISRENSMPGEEDITPYWDDVKSSNELITVLDINV